ncbi:MAG TPA: carboxypeptidase regulatory-like domain-containing protein [Gemmatimonadales bacterium]
MWIGTGWSQLRAQGLATAAISGAVTGADGRSVASGEVLVVHRATGFTAHGPVRHGRFLVQGLEVGGPYAVKARAAGFQEQVSDSLFLMLGQTLRVDFRLTAAAVMLPGITVAAERSPAFSRGRTGIASVISDSTLRRLPTANRDLYDFLRLSPHVSTQRGLSGGGVNFRFNRVLIDGASAQALFGALPVGTAAGGKLIPIEAVKEYQVLLSPHDVWQGDFAGVSVNAVTKIGTNEFQGSAYGFFRNEQLARDVAFLRSAPYQRAQYGFSLGGPIVRDRAHFFLATELQHYTRPASGPFVGQADSAGAPVPVDVADINRFAALLRSYGLEPGSAGAVSNGNPLANLFARLDVRLPGRGSRLVLEHIHSRVRDDRFERVSRPGVFPLPQGVFPLSSYAWHNGSRSYVTAARFYASFSNGAANELIARHFAGPLTFEPSVVQPLVLANAPLLSGAGPSSLLAGTNENVGGSVSQHGLEFRDNLTLLLGKTHRLTLGARVELYHVEQTGVFNALGKWEFASLDSLEQGVASSFTLARDFGGGTGRFSGALYGVHATDQWEVGDRISLIAGLRADLPVMHGRPPYAATVDSLFQRRTDVLPATDVLWSPRLGVNWDVTGDQRNQARAGVGLFVGPPPWNWWVNAFRNYGEGVRTLQCGTRPSDFGPAPAFTPLYQDAPTACANDSSFQMGPVNLLDRRLAFPRALRVSLGYDRRLPWEVVASLEGVYTRMLRDVLFINQNLRGPVGTDRHGRVLYGTFDSLRGGAFANLVSNRFPQVIDLASHSRNHSYELVAQLEKRFSDRLQATLGYAYSQVRDVQTPLNPIAINNWRGRALSGRHDALELGISEFDQPHRVVIAGSYAMPWSRWRTDVSFYYVGGSGTPFTYTATGNLSAGDLNADGTNLNDPIYVPRNSADTAEIRFAGSPDTVLSQQVAFDAFIDQTPCLRRQRGRIAERNSCRAPWVHTTALALRQALPAPRGHALSVEIQVFNLLNLLSPSWGLVRTPDTAPLSHVGQTASALPDAQPIFRFDPAFRPYNTDSPESYYQIQLAARYSF